MKKNILIFLVTIIIIFCIIGVIWTSLPKNDVTQTSSNETENIFNEMSNHINQIPENIIRNELANEIGTEPTEIDKIVTPPNILENGFELPINGASGYSSIATKVYKQNSTTSSIVKTLSPGTGFKILQEKNNWWYISISNTNGWIQSKYCMINLPDVLPSIIYDDTNSYSSIFMSSGKKLPNVTGKALYNVYTTNTRLNKKEYIMPIMYNTAKKIAKTQQLALKNNQSLKIYETFRPYETQKKVATSLSSLIEKDKTVKNGIYTNGWNKSWFIAQGLSNHQRGIALDVSLVNIEESKYIKIGSYTCLEISKYTECEMPTKMHELSAKAVTFKYGVDTQSKTAWKKVPYANSVTVSAKDLQNYFVKAGMYPISSEWWHFNDLDTKETISKNNSTGNFYITKCYSTIPE